MTGTPHVPPFSDGVIPEGQAPEINADDVQEVAALRCLECQHTVEADDFDGSPLYECGSCGTQFNRDGSADGDSNRCPQCNKFGGKVADHACPECETGEMEEVTGYLYDDELYVGDGGDPLDAIRKQMADRAREEREEQERVDRKARQLARRDELWRETPAKPAGHIEVGDIVMLRWPVVAKDTKTQVVHEGRPLWEYSAERIAFVHLAQPGAKFGDPGVSISMIGEPDTVSYGGAGSMHYRSIKEIVHVLTEQQAEEGGFDLR